MPPTVPINHYDGPRNQQNRTKRPILLFHANIFEQYACFEHSNFFKVKVLVRQEPQGLKVSQKERPRWKSSTRKIGPANRPKVQLRAFNCNNFNIRYWSWNYRGCWHQTCPQLFLVKVFTLYSFQLQDPNGPCIVIYCHYLPELGLGNLRACCLPWMW